MSSDIAINGSGLNQPSTQARPAVTTEQSATTSPVDKAAEQQRRVEQAKEAQKADQEQLKNLVEQVNSFAKEMSRNLNFSVDDPTGHTVITVTERESGDLIRKIPSEEFLALSQHIQDMSNLLFKEKA